MIDQAMIDLETFGVKSYSSIVSIGVVMFDITTGEIGDKLRIDIDLQSCIEIGLSMDASTVLWWLGQSTEAKQDLLHYPDYNDTKRVSISEALHILYNFLDVYKPKGVWGNGASFDLGLLHNAYEKNKALKAPWPYWAERDVRTLVSFAPDIKSNFINTLPHTPVNDCLYQIQYCSAIYRNIMNT